MALRRRSTDRSRRRPEEIHVEAAENNYANGYEDPVEENIARQVGWKLQTEPEVTGPREVQRFFDQAYAHLKTVVKEYNKAARAFARARRSGKRAKEKTIGRMVFMDEMYGDLVNLLHKPKFAAAAHKSFKAARKIENEFQQYKMLGFPSQKTKQNFIKKAFKIYDDIVDAYMPPLKSKGGRFTYYRAKDVVIGYWYAHWTKTIDSWELKKVPVRKRKAGAPASIRAKNKGTEEESNAAGAVAEAPNQRTENQRRKAGPRSRSRSRSRSSSRSRSRSRSSSPRNRRKRTRKKTKPAMEVIDLTED